MTERLRQIWKAAFGDTDAYLDLFFSTAYSPDRCIFTGDGAAYWFDCRQNEQKLAYVYAVAVDPRKQGQGLGTAMLHDLHRLLKARGYDAAILVPGEESLFRYYERLGYRTVSHIHEFTARAGTPIPARSIPPERYARLRRQHPVVIQEGENLALLKELAVFYEGENFLAAVDIHNHRCLELLGDPGAAPGLTAALGLKECHFRTPGTTRPFAMLKPLSNAPLPRSIHFGFPFD